MQFQALYSSSGTGLYLALHDGDGHEKAFGFTPYPAMGMLEYSATHYPRNMGFPAEDYTLSYDMCVGPFAGDWYDACQIYRQWATRQKWCAKGPLATRDDVPRWYKEAPLLLRTSTYSRDGRVARERERILAYLRYFQTELPIVWYGWKKDFPDMTHYNKPGSHWHVPEKRGLPCGNIHDGNYPALPALPSFAGACKTIAQAGGHVKAYVCAGIYDPGLGENAPLAAQAKPFAARDLDGRLQTAESGGVAWNMCYYPDWWQARMRDTVAALVEKEHVSGTYFDTFYGGRSFGHKCYDTAHGHSHAGGNDPYLGARRIATTVRRAARQANPDAVMSGEQPAETAIDLLDGFHVTTILPDAVPLLATVYGDYIVRGGNHLNPRHGELCYLQAATMLTAGAQMGRLATHGQHHLEASPEAMAFIRKLARYWRPEIGGRFLAYGQLVRPVRFTQPSPMPTCNYVEVSRYKRPFSVPALQNGVFRARDGAVGIFIVNISASPIAFAFQLDPARYRLAQSERYAITRIRQTGQRERTLAPGERGVAYHGRIQARDIVFLVVTPHATAPRPPD